MSGSFDHCFRTDARAAAEIKDHIDHGWPCSAARCRARPTHFATYRYVTGRGGRTTVRYLIYCRDHAARFAKKHGLELPPELALDWELGGGTEPWTVEGFFQFKPD